MKIGIVNDLPMAVECLKRVLLLAPDLEIAWVARNGREAVQYCALNPPNLVLMDLVMPEMNGVEATRIIMETVPCPILVVTASVTGHCSLVFEAMGAGALDAVATPAITTEKKGEKNGNILLEKIYRIAKITGQAPPSGKPGKPSFHPAKKQMDICRRTVPLVVIGSSTGGPQALVRVLSKLPADFPAAVVIVQHMDEQFVASLAEWLNIQTDLSVRVMANGERPQPGVVHLPRTSEHIILSPGKILRYSAGPEDSIHRPSIDVFFQSVARYWDGECIGVLLTGMGRDGAEGLLALRNKGFHTIAQDEKSSIVFGMPKVAMEIGAAVRMLPVEEIGATLRKRLGKDRVE